MSSDRRTAVAHALRLTPVVLVGTVAVVVLVMTGDGWLYSPQFWGALVLAAVAATLAYARAYPPRVTAGGRPVPPGRVVALRCALNGLVVAAAWHLVVAFDANARDLPLWLIAETFVVLALASHWLGESAAVEETLFTPLARPSLRRFLADDLILPVVHGVYVLCAGSAFVALLMTLPHLRWMPGWGTLLGAWLGGGVFGFVMTDAFVRLPPIKPVFEAAPVNGATGTRVSNMDVFVPYTIVAVLGGILLPVFAVARHKAGLPPIPVPHGLVWVPAVLAVVMAVLSVWARLTRDPAEDERERAEAQASYQQAVAGNRERRADLLACAGLIVAAWERRDGGDGPWMTEDTVKQLGARLWGRGISFPLPDSEALMTAESFLISVLRAAEARERGVEGDRPSLLSRKKAVVLSWEEAVTLTVDVAVRLREERPQDDPRLLRFLGRGPVRPEKITDTTRPNC